MNGSLHEPFFYGMIYTGVPSMEALMPDEKFEPFKPLGKPGKPSDFGIQPIGPSPLGGGDTHDTFGIDKDGTVRGGHTTVQLPGGPKVRLPWEPPEK